MGSNPVGASEFFSGLSLYYINARITSLVLLLIIIIIIIIIIMVSEYFLYHYIDYLIPFLYVACLSSYISIMSDLHQPSGIKVTNNKFLSSVLNATYMYTAWRNLCDTVIAPGLLSEHLFYFDQLTSKESYWVGPWIGYLFVC